MMSTYINSKTAMKRLQFRTYKCFKLHVGKTCEKNICRDLFVDGSKLDLAEDADTGQADLPVSFAKMKMEEEQV